jgi:hypothetical protein
VNKYSAALGTKRVRILGQRDEKGRWAGNGRLTAKDCGLLFYILSITIP